MQAQFVLYESASGYALFEVVQHDDIASLTDEVSKTTELRICNTYLSIIICFSTWHAYLRCLQVQASINDLQRFGRTVKLKAFQPFTTAENALENMNSISEHVLSDDLKVCKARKGVCLRTSICRGPQSDMSLPNLSYRTSWS